MQYWWNTPTKQRKRDTMYTGICEECGSETKVTSGDYGTLCKSCAEEHLGGAVRLTRYTLGGIAVHAEWTLI